MVHLKGARGIGQSEYKVTRKFICVRVIKAYVRQKYEIAQFGSVNTNLTKINIRAVQLISLMMPIIMLVVSGGIVATLWIGGEKYSMERFK